MVSVTLILWMMAGVSFAADHDRGELRPLNLLAGAFPPVGRHPNALVYIPAGFDPTPPLQVVVYLHGFNNCVENVVRDVGRPCTDRHRARARERNGHDLLAQLVASGKNAILLCPELAFDRRSGDPGTLNSPDGFRALLDETLQRLRPELGALSLSSIGRLVLVSHSAGYQAAASILSHGGVPVDELYLLDSLYGNVEDFERWIRTDLGSFSGAFPSRRFASIYTSNNGGTRQGTQELAARAASLLGQDQQSLVYDPGRAALDEALLHHGLIFKRTTLSHDQVPRQLFGVLLRSSGLRSRQVERQYTAQRGE